MDTIILLAMIFSEDDIKKDEIIIEFFDDRTISKNTTIHYIIVLKNYCNWKKQLPTDFIEEADIEQNKNIKLKKRKIKKDLISYIKFLKSEKKSESTIKNYLSCIKAIYNDNDIILPTKLPTGYSKDEKIKITPEGLPEINDIQLVHNIGDIRDKAIILLQLSSGMGASEVRHLIYDDFMKAFQLPSRRNIDIERDLEKLSEKEDDELIGWWSIRRYKTAYLFNTFNSPESTKELITYIKWRERNNKGIKNVDDPIFISRLNKMMGHVALNGVYARLNDKLGFERRKSNNRHYITSHQLREIFSNTLFRKKIDKLRIDYILGHRINPQDASYFRSHPEDLYAEYLKALPELTLEKVKVQRIESEEFQEIVRRLDRSEESKKKSDETIEFLLDKYTSVNWIIEAAEKSDKVKQALKDAIEKGIVKP